MSSKTHTTYVALLRGINVGGNTQLSMKELKKSFELLGFQNVSTFINSGNVVFQTSEKDPRVLETLIASNITKTFGYELVVVVRSFEEMKKVLRHVPTLWKQSNTQDYRCDIMFLHHSIDDKKILDELQPRNEVDHISYYQGAVYWSARKDEFTRSSMNKIVAKKICKFMTIRVYNSARRLFKLMEATEEIESK